MEPDLRVSVGQMMSVEWRMRKPEENNIPRSPNFTVGDSQCYLEVSYNHSGCKMYLYVDRRISFQFHVTAYFQRGDNLFYPETHTVQRLEGRFLIWKGENCYRKLEQEETWCFRIVFIHVTGNSKVHPENEQGLEFVPDNSGCLKSLANDLQQLHQASSDHDVKLRCDGQVLSAHGNILSARSEVFKTMLQTNMKENQTVFLDIKDMAFPALQQLLEYIYTGMLPDPTVESALQLYEVGYKYAVGGLKDWCVELLKSGMEDSNFCEILQLADNNNDQDLKECVFSYIRNFAIPKRWCGWQDFCDRHETLAVEFLNYLYEEDLREHKCHCKRSIV